MSEQINAAPNPPKVGQKVFLPELNVWGEIVSLYDDGGQLIQTIKVLVNGKPTLIEATFLVVKAVEQAGVIIRTVVAVWDKVKAPLKALCKALKICKEKPAAVPAAVEVELTRLGQSSTPSDIAKWQALRAKIAGLKS